MLKALLALTISLGLAAGSTGLGTAARFAEVRAEFEATETGIEVAQNAHLAAPENEHFEHTYLALVEHCGNLAAAYNVGSKLAPSELASANLPASLDIAACS
ncbi:hypothetical protein [Microbacterium sp. K24]|uniref:hypothetical protein n=1 Tax=Microbacterium sp. K24 TaxID=2305446 RepID=UPI00109CD22F|nr:hypothetical protein [Microbacterium sp. K24]